MPDHTHLLVEGLSDEADFKLAMMVARQRSSRACKQHVVTPSLWQDGYFERILRQDELVLLRPTSLTIPSRREW